MFTLIMASSLVGAMFFTFIDSQKGRERGTKYKEEAKQQASSYSKAYWENRRILQENENTYAYETDLGYITFVKKNDNRWDVSVSERKGFNTFLTFRYKVKNDKVKNNEWNKTFFNGWRGFLSMSDDEAATVSYYLKVILIRQIRQLINEENKEMEELPKENERKNRLAMIENGNYTIKTLNTELYKLTGETIAFQFEDNTMIEWTNGERFEKIEQFKNAKRIYSVKMDKEKGRIRQMYIDANVLKDVTDEEAFAIEEKKIWEAMKEEVARHILKRRTIQSVWERKIPKEKSHKEESLVSKRNGKLNAMAKEILDKIDPLMPYLDDLETEDTWYISRKLGNRMDRMRELLDEGSLTDEQMNQTCEEIFRRLDEIAVKTEQIKEKRGQQLVLLTKGD